MTDQYIDSHQHFWRFDPVRDNWITEDMSVIRRNFLPKDFKPLLDDHKIAGSIAVQADQSEAENTFLLNLADQHEFIKGVVGWVDLQANEIEDKLSWCQQFEKLKGFRHILQGEKQRDFMLRPAFKNGISKLRQFNYTYDILIFPDQLKFTIDFVEQFPDQPFVVDHLAKPYIKDKKIDEWRRDMKLLANYQNVYCKVSGMVTEADWKNWKKEDFVPYLDAVLESFGANRLMFGSDWPVCLVAASYDQMFNIVDDYFKSLSPNERNRIFGSNATQFYNL